MEVYNITRNEQTQKKHSKFPEPSKPNRARGFQVKETMIYTVWYYLLQGPLPCWHRLCMTRCYQMQKMYRKAVYYQLFYPSFWWKCYQHLENILIQASKTYYGFEDFLSWVLSPSLIFWVLDHVGSTWYGLAFPWFHQSSLCQWLFRHRLVVGNWHKHNQESVE